MNPAPEASEPYNSRKSIKDSLNWKVMVRLSTISMRLALALPRTGLLLGSGFLV